MVPAFNPMSCPDLAVPAEVMQHVVQVESGGNPFAIGVVGGRLERQPRKLEEAIATARMLESKGYDYSLGIAQINRGNLSRYGLEPFEKAFDACTNVAVGARILAECYSRSDSDWGKAFSCYYSGNFTAGYRDGYVQRVFASLGGGVPDSSAPITVHPQATEHPSSHRTPAARAGKPGSAAYRVSSRSVAIDPTGGALVSAPTGTTAPAQSPAPDTIPLPAIPKAADTIASAFVPRVSGPGDRPNEPLVPAAPTGAPPPPDQEIADAAFVF